MKVHPRLMGPLSTSDFLSAHLNVLFIRVRYNFCWRVLSTGGTTAYVVAGRLAACDPSLRILILEAGPHTLN
ncbi:hypothetical protein AZE42_02168, partial [Rhizopogon vesiculosus]